MNINKLCRYLAKANGILALLICALASWGMYALAPNPMAGVIIGALGAFIFAINYALWPLAGALVAQRRRLAAALPITTSLLISVLVIWSIHGVIDRGVKQQEAEVRHASERYEADKQLLEQDRALYAKLLVPVPVVVSAERASLQATISGLQAEASAKRLKNYDRPADRIDESVVALQGKLGELVRLDAAAAAKQAETQQQQAVEVMRGIKIREQSLADRSMSVPMGITPGEISALAFLAEFVCASVFFTIGLVGRSKEDETLQAERASVEVVQEIDPQESLPAPSPAIEALDADAQLVSLSEPVLTPVAPTVAVDHQSTEPLVLTPLPLAPEEVESAPAATSSSIALKPAEVERYKLFVAQIQGLPADHPIPVDQQATDLGFGKVLVSNFFKLAGEQGVIEKRGRQWFLSSAVTGAVN